MMEREALREKESHSECSVLILISGSSYKPASNKGLLPSAV